MSQLDSATLPARRTKRKTLSQVQEDADDSKQQQQEAAADDWGWGYSGPTLATIGSNYEKKLQAPAGIAAQPAQQQVADDNWDHEEGMQDWADDESLPDDDLAEDEAPDVTLLNGNDVVRQFSL